MSISLNAHVPFFCPLGIHRQPRLARFATLTEEILLSSNSYPFLSHVDEQAHITVSIIKHKTKWPTQIKKNADKWSNQVVIHFSVQLEDRSPLPGTWEIEFVEKNGIEFWQRTRTDLVIESLQKDIFDIILLTNIAAPHCLQSGEGTIHIDGKFYDTIENRYSGSPDVPEQADEFGWPNIDIIPLQTVIEWALKCPGFSDGFSSNPAGRALGALSYLFRPANTRDEVLDIFWVMLALEALYCSRKDGLAQQLHDRTQIYLGPRYSYKKRLKEAYAFRSDLIHGSMDFPFSSCLWDGTDSHIKFSHGMIEAYYFVLVTLLGTLQKMCVDNRYALSFTEKLEPSMREA